MRILSKDELVAELHNSCEFSTLENLRNQASSLLSEARELQDDGDRLSVIVARLVDIDKEKLHPIGAILRYESLCRRGCCVEATTDGKIVGYELGESPYFSIKYVVDVVHDFTVRQESWPSDSKLAR